MKNRGRIKSFGAASLFLVHVLANLIVVTPKVYAFSGSGDGTSEHPYQITTCEQLQSINDDLAANYELGGNIDCSDSINWDEGAGFAPIGGSLNVLDNAFQGTFNGRGHSINGLYINRPDYPAVGLFATTVGATISHVTVNGTIIGADFTGGVVGFAYILTNITDVTANVDVTGIATSVFGEGLPFSGAGGIVGLAVGELADGFAQQGVTVSESVSTGSVSAGYADSTVFNTGGGLIGLMMDQTTVSDSYSTADVISTTVDQIAVGGAIGGSFVYGFTGDESVPKVNNIYSTGTVTALDGNIVGGLIGVAQGSGEIKNSFTTSPINVPGDFNIDNLGNFLANQGEGVVLIDNFLDVGRTMALTCVGGGFGDSEGCTGINYGEGTGDENYFFGNHTNPPLNAWDFDCTWATQVGDYPVLDLSRSGCPVDAPENTDDETTHHTKKIPKPKVSSAITTEITNLFATSSDFSQETINLSKMGDYTNGKGQELGNLKVGQVIKFDIIRDGKTEHHTITIKKIGYGSITITVASKPFDVTLDLNQTKTITIDGQKVMKVKLTTLSGGSATMFFSKIASPTDKTAITANSASTDPSAVNYKDTAKHDARSTTQVLLSLLGLALLLTTALFILNRNKQPSK